MDRVIMKPEGSRKVAVLNGSRQLDKVIGGEWVTLKVEAEAGLPKGVYFLDEAQRPPVKREPESYTWAVLQVDLTTEKRRGVTLKGWETRRARHAKQEAERKAELRHADTLRQEIAALEATLFAPENMAQMKLAAAAFTGKKLLQPVEIAAAALPWEHASGVYFLLDGDEVVYVGQARNVYSRISQHKDKEFCRYAFVPCAVEALDRLESLYIHWLRPKLNGWKPDGTPFAPLALDALIGLVPNAKVPAARAFGASAGTAR